MKILATVILTSAFWLVAFMSGMISTGGGRQGDTHKQEVADPTPVHYPEMEARGSAVALDPGARPQLRMAPSVEIGPNGLAVPVAGIAPDALVYTFTQARAGGARRHDAIDIMAPRGTPVVASAEGVLEKIHFSEGGGGKSLYVRSDDRRWIYYYAHLERYAAGLEEGQRVVLGQKLGTVGFSGNANPDGPHLHFAINRMEEQEDWWEGRPINPYPLLAGSGGDR